MGAPAASALATTALAHPLQAGAATGNSPRAVANRFEEVFLSNVMSEMFSGITGDGPLGTAGAGGSVWRSMLTDQFAHQFAAHGGIGLADQVTRQLVQLQESPS